MIPAIHNSRMALFNAKVQRFHMTPEVGVTPSDILNPDYWRQVAYMLKAGALIDVLSEDGSVDGELRVLSSTRTSARVKWVRLGYIDPPAAKAAPAPKAPDKPVKGSETVEGLPESITIGWGGPAHKHRVVHNGEPVSTGHPTREAAVEAARAYHAEKLAA